MPKSNSFPPKVFISYSWDSDKHKDDVLDLADRLRSGGIDCSIDQYETSPAEGWPHWMRDQIDQSDFVIVVCTEKYKLRFTGKEELGKGKGVAWEGAIINQFLYDQVSNTKFIPLIFSPQDKSNIPSELRRFTFYLVNSEKGYEDLYRRLTNQPSTKKPQLGRLQPLLPRKRQHDECEALYPQDERLDSQGQFISSVSLNSEEKRALEEARQKRLDELYREAKKRHKARQWKEVAAIFRRLQEENLPYFDPDSLYGSARDQLVKERDRKEREQKEREQKKRKLEDFYRQGTNYYKTKDWQEARRRFEEILKLDPSYKNTEVLLVQIREKQEREKRLFIAGIATVWLFAGWIGTSTNLKIAGGIGGGVSGLAIAWISRQTELSIEKQLGQLFLFGILGLLGGLFLGGLIDLIDAPGLFAVKPLIMAIFGWAIACGVMFWRLRQLEHTN